MVWTPRGCGKLIGYTRIGMVQTVLIRVDRLAKIRELNARKIKASFVCVILYTLTQEFLSNHFDALSYSFLDGTFSHGPGRKWGQRQDSSKGGFWGC